MAYEQRDMSGSLFKNDRKESDSHPDYKGTALINGVEHWLDAWINTSAKGDKYMSLKLKPKEGGGGIAAPGATSSRPQPAAFDDPDDVPFATADASLEWKVG